MPNDLQPHPLELKVPPPIAALLTAGIIWCVARLTPLAELPMSVRQPVAIALGALGIGLIVAGMLRFRAANTTIHPVKPQKTSALVRTGIYRVSRNPMYLGLLLALCGWTVWCSAPWGLLGLVAFALYIRRFQIVPEERVLFSKFGADYAQYTARVRRWL